MKKYNKDIQKLKDNGLLSEKSYKALLSNLDQKKKGKYIALKDSLKKKLQKAS